jgi:hypothetical protein
VNVPFVRILGVFWSLGGQYRGGHAVCVWQHSVGGQVLVTDKDGSTFFIPTNKNDLASVVTALEDILTKRLHEKAVIEKAYWVD